MKNCILYKNIEKSFLKQITFSLTLIISSVVIITLKIISSQTIYDNTPYFLFLIMIFSWALFILISSYKSRTENLNNLNRIKQNREFDEVIFESTISEVIKRKKNYNDTISYLMILKNRGEIFFQMMFNPNDFKLILHSMKELSCKRNVLFISKIEESNTITHNLNILLPEVS